MGYDHLFEEHDRALLSDWLQETGELYVDLHRPHSGGDNSSVYFASTLAQLKEIVASEGHREVSITIFRQKQYPIRGWLTKSSRTRPWLSSRMASGSVFSRYRRYPRRHGMSSDLATLTLIFRRASLTSRGKAYDLGEIRSTCGAATSKILMMPGLRIHICIRRRSPRIGYLILRSRRIRIATGIELLGKALLFRVLEPSLAVQSPAIVALRLISCQGLSWRQHTRNSNERRSACFLCGTIFTKELQNLQSVIEEVPNGRLGKTVTSGATLFSPQCPHRVNLRRTARGNYTRNDCDDTQDSDGEEVGSDIQRLNAIQRGRQRF